MEIKFKYEEKKKAGEHSSPGKETKLEDETYDPPEINFPDFGAWWSKAKTGMDKLLAVLRMIALVVIAVAVVWLVSKLVRVFRTIFENFRGRG